jgi:uncharacterized protein YjbJ (UPF0337 family)
MMRAGLGIRLDGHGAGPQLLRAGAGEIDRGLAVHPRRRRHVGIKPVAGNDPHTVVLPALVVVMMIVGTGHDDALLRKAGCDRSKNRDHKPDRRGTFDLPGNCPVEASPHRRDIMGSTADKVKGAANEAIGKAKQGVGEAVGSDRLQGEGVIQEVKGKGQKVVGDAKEATKDAIDRAAAAANKNL